MILCIEIKRFFLSCCDMMFFFVLLSSPNIECCRVTVLWNFFMKKKKTGKERCCRSYHFKQSVVTQKTKIIIWDTDRPRTIHSKSPQCVFPVGWYRSKWLVFSTRMKLSLFWSNTTQSFRFSTKIHNLRKHISIKMPGEENLKVVIMQ